MQTFISHVVSTMKEDINNAQTRKTVTETNTHITKDYILLLLAGTKVGFLNQHTWKLVFSRAATS